MACVKITGIGIVTSLGIGMEEAAEAFSQKRTGITDLTLFEPCGKCEHAAEIDEYDWQDYLFSKQTYADRTTQFAVGAARQALEAGGLSLPYPEDAEPVGLTFGTMSGCLASAETFFEPVATGRGKRASSLVFSHSYPNCPTSFVAIELGLHGYSTSFAGSPAAGAWALRSAFDVIASGEAPAILAGAAESLSPAFFSHCEASGQLPDTAGKEVPDASSEDFSNWQSVPGEGAVFFLLESADHAAARGAKAIAEVRSITESAPDEAKAAFPCKLCGNLFAAATLLDITNFLATAATGDSAVANAKDSSENIAIEVVAG